jgi:hypothetical protein
MTRIEHTLLARRVNRKLVFTRTTYKALQSPEPYPARRLLASATMKSNPTNGRENEHAREEPAMAQSSFLPPFDAISGHLIAATFALAMEKQCSL